jgi:hypothetical protein
MARDAAGTWLVRKSALPKLHRLNAVCASRFAHQQVRRLQL